MYKEKKYDKKSSIAHTKHNESTSHEKNTTVQKKTNRNPCIQPTSNRQLIRLHTQVT